MGGIKPDNALEYSEDLDSSLRETNQLPKNPVDAEQKENKGTSQMEQRGAGRWVTKRSKNSL